MISSALTTVVGLQSVCLSPRALALALADSTSTSFQQRCNFAGTNSLSLSLSPLSELVCTQVLHQCLPSSYSRSFLFAAAAVVAGAAVFSLPLHTCRH